MPYGDVVMALSIVLRIRRTMNGTEIDQLISDALARKARVIEPVKDVSCLPLEPFRQG